MKTYIDLHIHSTASDGTFSPTEIVNKALNSQKKTALLSSPSQTMTLLPESMNSKKLLPNTKTD